MPPNKRERNEREKKNKGEGVAEGSKEGLEVWAKVDKFVWIRIYLDDLFEIITVALFLMCCM